MVVEAAAAAVEQQQTEIADDQLLVLVSPTMAAFHAATPLQCMQHMMVQVQ
jgi:hypothetical protein